MDDQFDVSLSDPELLDEVEMTTNLIVAATESDGPLSQEQIDRVLGLGPVREADTARDQSPTAGEAHGSS